MVLAQKMLGLKSVPTRLGRVPLAEKQCEILHNYVAVVVDAHEPVELTAINSVHVLDALTYL